ncbi:MAG: proprotein convertase P-domain-containing protein [Anaerolineae bacterium]
MKTKWIRIPLAMLVTSLVLMAVGPTSAVTPAAPPGCTSTPATFTNTTPVTIPTGPAVISSTLTVSGAGAYLLDLDLTTVISHTFAADLDITLASPQGTIVTLSTDNGGSNDNVFAGTLWDDNADPDGQVPYTSNNGLVTDQVYVNLTTASPLAPEEAMGAFVGEDPNGVWALTISDDAAADGGTLNSWSLTVTTAACGASIALTKTAGADPAVCAVTSAITVTAGTPVYYCYNIENTGAITLTQHDLVDNRLGTILSGFPITLTPGASASLTQTTTITQTTVNTATWTAYNPGPTDLVSDTDTATVMVQIAEAADLSFTKTDSPDPVTVGQILTYTLAVNNAGPSNAASVTVTDTLPGGVTLQSVSSSQGGCTALPCSLGTLNASSAASVTVVVAVSAGTTGTLTNTAGVSSATPDPNPGNNTDSEATAVTVYNMFLPIIMKQ